jgi:hypothetical protein
MKSKNEPIELREIANRVPDSDDGVTCDTFGTANGVDSDQAFTIVVFDDMVSCLWIVVGRLRKFG